MFYFYLQVIVTMILSIIAAVLSTGVMSQGAIGALISPDYHRNWHCKYDSYGRRQCSYRWVSVCTNDIILLDSTGIFQKKKNLFSSYTDIHIVYHIDKFG